MKKNVEVKAYRTMFDTNKPITGPDGKITYPVMRDDKGNPVRKERHGTTVELERGDIPDEYLEPVAKELGISIDQLIEDINGQGIRLGTQKRLAQDIVVGSQPTAAQMKEALVKIAEEAEDFEFMKTIMFGKKEVIAKLYLEHCVG